jgi:hypothetical protein
MTNPETYKTNTSKFGILTKDDKHEYMFATEAEVTDGILRLACPDVGGGNLANHRGCRNSVKMMSDPNFQPKAVIFFVGTLGSFGRGLYWVHRFDLNESSYYVRDTGGSKAVPREYNRLNKRTGLYKTTIYLIKTEVEGIDWEPPSLL